MAATKGCECWSWGRGQAEPDLSWDRSWDGMGQETGMDTSVSESIGMEDV